MAAAAESLAKRQDEHKRGTPPESDSTGECPQARMRLLGVETERREGSEAVRDSLGGSANPKPTV